MVWLILSTFAFSPNRIYFVTFGSTLSFSHSDEIGVAAITCSPFLWSIFLFETTYFNRNGQFPTPSVYRCVARGNMKARLADNSKTIDKYDNQSTCQFQFHRSLTTFIELLMWWFFCWMNIPGLQYFACRMLYILKYEGKKNILSQFQWWKITTLSVNERALLKHRGRNKGIAALKMIFSSTFSCMKNMFHVMACRRICMRQAIAGHLTMRFYDAIWHQQNTMTRMFNINQ